MKISVILFLILAILILSGETFPKTRRVHHINANFFLTTNDDVGEALASYAEAICIQDQVTDSSPESWLVASAKCADTYRDDVSDKTSDDGGWKAYSMAAYEGIVALCAERGNVDDLCKKFTGSLNDLR